MIHTGVGSWPGVDMAAAVRLTLGELLDEAYLPELPARGPGAAIIGRTCGMLTGLSVDLQPQGWRLIEGTGLAQRRARRLLRDDLDLLEEHGQGYQGRLRVTLAGPLTLAASVELPRGGAALRDRGATRDLRDAQAEAAVWLAGEAARRLPAAEVLVQVDEPMLGAVRRGSVPTASGLNRLPAWDDQDVSAHLAPVRQRLAGAGLGAGRTLVHSCAPDPGVAAILAAGFDGVGLDAGLIDNPDEIGVALETGHVLHLGVAPTFPVDRVPRVDDLVRTALGVLRPLELGPAVTDRVVLAPACGLAGWRTGPATELLRRLGRAVPLIVEELSR